MKIIAALAKIFFWGILFPVATIIGTTVTFLLYLFIPRYPKSK